jgi:cysteine desulfurase
MRQIYLDNNATTPMDPGVLEAMEPYLVEAFGNASSAHSVGQGARKAVDEARESVADAIGCRPSEVVFTSGGTEADNLAILGASLAYRHGGNHIVTTQIEHPAVLRACEYLESDGFRVTFLGVDSDGLVDVAELEESLTDSTILVSVMTANNETGTLEPIRQVSNTVRSRGVLLHVDAVQSIGKLPVDVDSLGVDLLSLSGHKFHGPKGVGALYVRTGVDLVPQSLGGGQERGRRGGTTNVPGVVGLGRACALAKAGLGDFEERIGALRDKLESGLLQAVPECLVNGSTTSRAPHVSNLSFCGFSGESLLVALDFEGIAVSTGAACSSGTVSPSHVLAAMKLPEDQINGAIRFSLSRMTTESEIDDALQVIRQVVTRMRDACSVRDLAASSPSRILPNS